ncbi:MAG: hypothetical protein RIR00_1090 [Pseudomonadota bacterium]|jgi:CRP-like cAMP-binding protein
MRKVLFILGQLSDDDVELLASQGRRRDVPAGECIIRQGEAVSEIFILIDGRMEVSVTGFGPVAEIGSGEIIGEMSFIDRRPPAASVTALGPCRLLALSRSGLEAQLAAHPPFAARFYKAIATFLSDRLRGTVSRLGFGNGLTEETEMEDELDLGVLENLHLAGGRFDRMLKRLGGAP